MTLQQLRYFMTVCETGSTTLAADILYVSQPAISKSLRELEREWGVQLFTRQRNRLEITESGKVAYEKAQKLIAMADEFGNTMYAMGTQKRSISVVMNGTMAILLFPTLITDFKKEYPDIEVRLIEVKEHADERLKNDPKCDVLIMSSAHHLMDLQKFKAIHLMDTEYVILAGENTTLSQYKEITPDLHCDRPMITDYYPRDLYGDCFIPKRLESFLNGHSIRVHSGQFFLNIDAIRAGEAYGYTFKEIAQRYDRVKGIPLQSNWIQSIDAYYPLHKKNNLALQAFISYLKTYDYSKL